MTAPRGLSEEERAAWERLAATVTPLNPPPPGEGDHGAKRHGGGARAVVQKLPAAKPSPPVSKPVPPPLPGKRPVPLHPDVARRAVYPERPACRPAEGRRGPPPRAGEDGLDSHWDRRLKAGSLAPDFTLDLHGHTLDAAHARLESGLFQARAMGARVVLLIAGKPRPADPADRGARRGAIRAKILDWLAAGPHGADIAAIRNAHRRHGGEGALYLVLKRRR